MASLHCLEVDSQAYLLCLRLPVGREISLWEGGEEELLMLFITDFEW